MILQTAEQQKREFGDASGWVVAMIGEWLRLADALLRLGLTPTQVVEGYEVAGGRALEAVRDLSVPSTDLPSLIRTVIAAKQFGQEEFLGGLVLKAFALVREHLKTGPFDPDNVRIVKVMGAALGSSFVTPGMLFNRDAEGSVKRVVASCPEGAFPKMSDAVKVAVFACPIGNARTETKGTVLFSSADQMLSFNREEEAQLAAQIGAIAGSGVQVVVSNDTISEVALNVLDSHGILACKVTGKWDFRRICRALGATALARFGAPLAEELGYAAAVETVEVGSDRCLVFRAIPSIGSVSTVVLRGSSPNYLDDVERALDDALATLRIVTASSRTLASQAGLAIADPLIQFDVLPGAGACELELGKRLRVFAASCPGVIQYAMRRFAEGFDRIPMVLAASAGYDDEACIALLHASPSINGIRISDCDEPSDSADSQQFVLSDPISNGILDLTVTKLAAIRHAIQATLTILRVDQIIMSRPAGGPAPRSAGPADDF